VVEKSIEANNNGIKIINKRIDNLENDMKLIKNSNPQSSIPNYKFLIILIINI
jgi:hypothetical protein